MLSLPEKYRVKAQKLFLQDTDNWRYWVTLAIIVKISFAIFIFSQNIPPAAKTTFYTCGGDTNIYLGPVDNLIERGTYSPDYRMPGYGAPYFILRQFFTQDTSKNLLVVMQLFLSGVSVYALAATAMHIFGSKKLFYWVFYAYLVSTYTAVFDIYLLSDSLAVSTLIFAAFWFVRGMKNPDYRSFFLSGLFLTWCIFLKPISLPVAGLFVIILAMNHGRRPDSKNRKFKPGIAIVLFLSALVLFDGAWVVRNYKIYGRITLLQGKTDYPQLQNDEVYVGLQRFLGAWGGDYIWWNPNAEIGWFGYMRPCGSVKGQIRDIKFPAYIYTTKFNYGDLVDVKNYIALSEAPATAQDERVKFRQSAARRLNEYADSIKKEKPLIYYIFAPLRILKIFLIYSGTYNLFNKTNAELNIFELGIKFFMSALYLFVIFAGFPTAVYLIFKNGVFNMKSAIAVVAVYFTLIYPFVFRKCEYRYFVQAYPFMLACAVYLATSVYGLIAAGDSQKGL